MKHKMLVFMGGQGSGKGTFAHKLLEQNDYNYIEVGAILRTLPCDSKIGQLISRGELVQDSDLFELLPDYINENSDIIMDGFPRTIGQAKWLIEQYANQFDIYVLYLDITEETMRRHIQKRICEGGNRKDDADENAVCKRILSFKEKTMPAIQWLSGLNNIKFFAIVLPSDDIETNFDYIIKNTGI